MHITWKGRDDAFNRLTVFGAARETAVQIDHVEMLRARFCKQQRLRGGIIAIHGGAVHIALGQPDDLTLFQVDCGKDYHGFHSRNRSSNARP